MECFRPGDAAEEEEVSSPGEITFRNMTHHGEEKNMGCPLP